MKQTITIDVPEGKDAIHTIDENGNIIIKYVDKEPVRSKSWEEFCKNHPNPTHEWFVGLQNHTMCYGLYTCTTDKDRVLFPQFPLVESAEDAEGILALIQLMRLRDEWVGNWKSSTKDDNFWLICNSTNDGLTVRNWWYSHTFLVFPTEKMAQEFLECFHYLIKKAKKFI